MNHRELKKWIAFIGIGLASFLGCIDFTIVNTVLPNIQTDLHAKVTLLQWVITAFMLALSATMVMAGKFADEYGRVRMLYVGLLIFGLASLGAGLSTSVQMLIAFRVVQGLGVAILYTVPIALIPSLFPSEQRNRAMGLLIGINGFGLAVGPVVGGLMVSVLSWHWVFLINIPLILASALLCCKTLPFAKSTVNQPQIDRAGGLLMLCSLPLMVLLISEGGHWGWLSFTTLILAGLTVVLWVTWLWVERRTPSPMIDFDLFRQRDFLLGVGANVLLSFFYTTAFFIMPLCFSVVFHQSGGGIGLLLLPATLMVALLSPVAGWAINKVGSLKVVGFGFVMFAISAYWQTHFDIISGMGSVIGALLVLGIGWACILSPSISAAMASTPEKRHGVAMGCIGTFHNFGGAVGLAVGTVVYYHAATGRLMARLPLSHEVSSLVVNQPETAAAWIHHHLGTSLVKAQVIFEQSFLHGYHQVMGLLVGISLLGFFGVWLGSWKK